MRLPTVDAWNATIQHQLTRTISIEAGYVGNKEPMSRSTAAPLMTKTRPTIVGVCRWSFNDQRRPYFAKFGWNSPLNFFGNDTDNHYNSLQTKVEKRFNGGWQLLANYTYSHAKSHDSPYFDIDRNLWYGRPDWQRTTYSWCRTSTSFPSALGKRFLGNSNRGRQPRCGWLARQQQHRLDESPGL